MIASDDPFRAVHRAHRRAVWARICGVSVVAAIGLGLVSLADAVPTPIAAVAAASTPGVLAEQSPSAPDALALRAADEIPALATLPVVAVAASAEAPALPATPTAPVDPPGPTRWQIAIDTVGYQAELDECLWVRMNLDVQAPFVGAHNYCGGGIVLEMALGEQVTLSGTELDGNYVVTESRDAWVGNSARAATEGMTADVILQTCYWGGDGRLRLVGLTLAAVG